MHLEGLYLTVARRMETLKAQMSAMAPITLDFVTIACPHYILPDGRRRGGAGELCIAVAW